MIALLFFFFLPGCSKQCQSYSYSKNLYQIPQHNNSPSLPVLGPELYGIPIPFCTFHQVISSDLDNQKIWRYQTQFPLYEVIAFFGQNMDQSGWQSDLTVLSKEESLLAFSKPSMVCTICIHAARENTSEFLLFLHKQKE